jgi:TM2 domain-containing membrane protein YozV
MNNNDSIVISYLLWCACFLGVSGLHRLYNGKIFTGLLWLFTLGFFGIGQFVDLFLIPSMVNENQLRKRNQLEDPRINSFSSPYSSPWSITSRTVSQSELMILLTKAAQKRGGTISLTQAVLDIERSYEEIQATLDQMMKKGYIIPGNDPDKGFVVYHFLEL